MAWSYSLTLVVFALSIVPTQWRGDQHIKNMQIFFCFICNTKMNSIKLNGKVQKAVLDHPTIWLGRHVSKETEDGKLMLANIILSLPGSLLQLLYSWTLVEKKVKIVAKNSSKVDLIKLSYFLCCGDLKPWDPVYGSCSVVFLYPESLNL